MSWCTRATAIAAAFVLIVLPASAAADSDPGTADWERVPRDRVAAECGMDPALLEEATPRLTDTPFVVVRFGKLCWEGGYPGGTTQTYHAASVTKTFGALLTGLVDARSTLSDEDVVTRWIDREDLGAINPAARIAHVLSMASTSEDLRYGKKKKWSYDTLGDREINQLVGVMNKVIAAEKERFPGVRDARELAQKEVFDALGMRASNWPGQAIGGTMNSTVRDMARLGELILQRGRYNGRQLIDESYMYKLTHPAFEDSNTGYGYLTYANADQNWAYSTGTNDTACAPFTRWPSYPHGPFFEAPDPNGGFPGAQRHDVGLVWAAGAGGQRIVVHRALDMVIVVRDDAVAVNETEDPVAAYEGHKTIFNAIRPALVKLDPVYRGDEEAFCRAYHRSEYAPTFHEPWFAPAGGAGAGGSAPSVGGGGAAATLPPCGPARGFDAFAVRANRRGGLDVRATRKLNRRFTFTLLREAGNRLVVATRRSSTRDAFSVRPGRRTRDGYYLARVQMALPGGSVAVRRVALRRTRGRFRVRPDAELLRTCGVLESFTLARSVFTRSLGVAYKLRRDAEQVTVRVLDGRGQVVTGPATAGRTHRVRVSPRGIGRRRDVRIQITVRAGGVDTTETLTARRL